MTSAGGIGEASRGARNVLTRLQRLVELESPSGDEARLRSVAAELAADLITLGAQVETEDVAGVGDHVIGRFPASGAEAKPLLVLGHLDTVHPVGSFRPVFHVQDGRAHGPGTFDMKGGWACMLEALHRLRQSDREPSRPLILLATCDEETGSTSSRELIERLGAGAHAVLVPEPPLEGGAAKTRRKGVGWYRIKVTGRAAHAGLAPEDGVNALVELAHQLLEITRLGDPAAGTTVTAGKAGGGTAANVVPAEAWALVDVRFTQPSEGERVDAALRALRPRLEGASLSLEGGIDRPPMERTEEIGQLYDHARRIAAAADWELREGLSGGASDGSLTAALGVPTLDGLGPAGAGAHAPTEHVLVEDLPRRVRLYEELLTSL